MKIKNIVNALPSLQKLAAVELPCRVLYKINKLMDSLESELKFYNKQRDQIFQKYNVQMENGNLKLQGNDIEAFEREFNELLNLEVEDIKSIDVPADDNIKLSYNDVKALEGIINIQFEEGVA